MTIDQKGGSVVAVIDEAFSITDVRSALDLMADANSLHGAGKLAISKAAVAEAFFDLKTGLAGDVLQKYANYGVKAAFYGDFSVYDSKSLRDFIREANRGSSVLFTDSREEAIERLHALPG
jgi:hypothetical protein